MKQLRDLIRLSHRHVGVVDNGMRESSLPLCNSSSKRKKFIHQKAKAKMQFNFQNQGQININNATNTIHQKAKFIPYHMLIPALKYDCFGSYGQDHKSAFSNLPPWQIIRAHFLYCLGTFLES